jgi:GR25 family glycosyltransferase involved in LPS biosynthesis
MALTHRSQLHALPSSLFDGNNFNTSPPVAACAVSHVLAWRAQRQGRGLLVLEDDVNMVLDARDRIEELRQRAREVGAKLLMMAPGETFEEDTVTCAVDEDDCSGGDDGGVRVLREKMTLYGQVLEPLALRLCLRRNFCGRQSSASRAARWRAAFCCAPHAQQRRDCAAGLPPGRGRGPAAAGAAARRHHVRGRLVAGADVARRPHRCSGAVAAAM